jgi:adenosine deaminase
MKPGKTRLILIFILALTICCPVSSTTIADFINPLSPDHDIVVVDRYFESVSSNPDEIRAFFYAMPKGGDLHTHLSGSVYAEDIIDIAARHNLVVDPATGQLFDPATGQPSGVQMPTSVVPVSAAYGNATLYNALVGYWSMRDYIMGNQSGHDQFFGTFDLIDPVTYYNGDVIATIRNRAADENIQYLELMTSQTDTEQVQEIVAAVDWDDNFSVLRKNFLDAGLDEILDQKVRTHEFYDRESWELASPAGKNVTVRYGYEALRFYPKKEVFASLLQAFEIANRSPVVVGINLVGDEAAYYSRTDYRLHMEMVSYLASVYPNVLVSHHAGELTPGLVPPEDLRFHIADAVFTGKASRIGHGVDILSEDNWNQTLAEMIKRDIPVEILLTSNEQILMISGDDHPISVYLDHQVPVVIATDDPGIERTDLSGEFVKLTLQHPELRYENIRAITINSIRYSYLPGVEKEQMLVQFKERLEQFERTIAKRERPFMATVLPSFSMEPRTEQDTGVVES